MKRMYQSLLGAGVLFGLNLLLAIVAHNLIFLFCAWIVGCISHVLISKIRCSWADIKDSNLTRTLVICYINSVVIGAILLSYIASGDIIDIAFIILNVIAILINSAQLYSFWNKS